MKIRFLIILLSILAFPIIINAAPVAPTVPAVPAPSPVISLDLNSTSSALPVQIIVLLTLLSFIPAILISMTCFTRLIVVFHFLRQALGTQEAPNNQILIGLALFITLFVMGPIISRINTEALQPMTAGEITQTEAVTRALVPLRAFMLKHTRERDLAS
jgi:flagellar biosynthesis protein FliP